ncbi:D-ribose pyranase [Massiliimalia timonensis]|uniref:D-ribose pyranase n=1 Tax=Massiliimalia timonensis TaxID=1987501 RepID=UPI00189FF9E8|nr:D-ribose pyranase [Massiliimalia timonensis]
MKKSGILNPELCAVIAGIGHTEFLVIADPGLPIPKGVSVIDLSLVRDIPKFMDVLEAVKEELVIESFFIATEIKTQSKNLYQQIRQSLPGLPESELCHEEFKRKLAQAKAVIRTGETTSYANIALVAGVNF